MHPKILAGVVDRVRKRIAEGDCPVTPPEYHENLELAVIDLADEVERLTSNSITAENNQ